MNIQLSDRMLSSVESREQGIDELWNHFLDSPDHICGSVLLLCMWAPVWPQLTFYWQVNKWSYYLFFIWSFRTLHTYFLSLSKSDHLLQWSGGSKSVKYFLPLWFFSILTVVLWLRHNKCSSLFWISNLSCRVLSCLLGAGELGSISGHLIVCSLLFPFAHTAASWEHSSYIVHFFLYHGPYTSTNKCDV